MNKEIKEILDGLNVVIKQEGSLEFDFKECKKILDYITNLQEDLKYRKEMYDEYCDKHTKLMQEYSNLQKENETLKELNVCVGCNNNPDYKTRIDKAIEYIKENSAFLENDEYEVFNKKELLDILEGSDKSE